MSLSKKIAAMAAPIAGLALLARRAGLGPSSCFAPG